MDSDQPKKYERIDAIKSETNGGPVTNASLDRPRYKDLTGIKIKKFFPQNGWQLGQVVSSPDAKNTRNLPPSQKDANCAWTDASYSVRFDNGMEREFPLYALQELIILAMIEVGCKVVLYSYETDQHFHAIVRGIDDAKTDNIQAEFETTRADWIDLRRFKFQLLTQPIRFEAVNNNHVEKEEQPAQKKMSVEQMTQTEEKELNHRQTQTVVVLQNAEDQTLLEKTKDSQTQTIDPEMCDQEIQTIAEEKNSQETQTVVLVNKAQETQTGPETKEKIDQETQTVAETVDQETQTLVLVQKNRETQTVAEQKEDSETQTVPEIKPATDQQTQTVAEQKMEVETQTVPEIKLATDQQTQTVAEERKDMETQTVPEIKLAKDQQTQTVAEEKTNPEACAPIQDQKHQELSDVQALEPPPEKQNGAETHTTPVRDTVASGEHTSPLISKDSGVELDEVIHTGVPQEDEEPEPESDDDAVAVVLESGSNKSRKPKSKSDAETVVLKSPPVATIRKNMRLAILWDQNDEYYAVTVTCVRKLKLRCTFQVEYEDGFREWTNLADREFYMLDDFLAYEGYLNSQRDGCLSSENIKKIKREEENRLLCYRQKFEPVRASFTRTEDPADVGGSSDLQEARKKTLNQLEVGRRVAVWSTQKLYQKGTIHDEREKNGAKQFHIKYDNGDKGWLSFEHLAFIIMVPPEGEDSQQPEDLDTKPAAVAIDAAATGETKSKGKRKSPGVKSTGGSSKKRRRSA